MRDEIGGLGQEEKPGQKVPCLPSRQLPPTAPDKKNDPSVAHLCFLCLHFFGRHTPTACPRHPGTSCSKPRRQIQFSCWLHGTNLWQLCCVDYFWGTSRGECMSCPGGELEQIGRFRSREKAFCCFSEYFAHPVSRSCPLRSTSTFVITWSTRHWILQAYHVTPVGRDKTRGCKVNCRPSA